MHFILKVPRNISGILLKMNKVILKTSHQTKKFIILKIEKKYFTKFQNDAAKRCNGKLLFKCSLKIELSNKNGEGVDIINIT